VLGFFGSLAAGRNSFPQTYSTTRRDHPAWTPIARSNAYAAWFGGDYAHNDNLNDLRAAYDNLRAQVERLSQLVNGVIDDLQRLGLFS
jgi:hypothetical protein